MENTLTSVEFTQNELKLLLGLINLGTKTGITLGDLRAIHPILLKIDEKIEKEEPKKEEPQIITKGK